MGDRTGLEPGGHKHVFCAKGGISGLVGTYSEHLDAFLTKIGDWTFWALGGHKHVFCGNGGISGLLDVFWAFLGLFNQNGCPDRLGAWRAQTRFLCEWRHFWPAGRVLGIFRPFQPKWVSGL